MEDEKMTLDELDATIEELMELGLVQSWPSKEFRFRAVTEKDIEEMAAGEASHAS